jgi:hypothetical protein
MESGDRIALDLDVSPHYRARQRELDGRWMRGLKLQPATTGTPAWIDRRR